MYLFAFKVRKNWLEIQGFHKYLPIKISIVEGPNTGEVVLLSASRWQQSPCGPVEVCGV